MVLLMDSLFRCPQCGIENIVTDDFDDSQILYCKQCNARLVFEYDEVSAEFEQDDNVIEVLGIIEEEEDLLIVDAEIENEEILEVEAEEFVEYDNYVNSKDTIEDYGKQSAENVVAETGFNEEPPLENWENPRGKFLSDTTLSDIKKLQKISLSFFTRFKNNQILSKIFIFLFVGISLLFIWYVFSYIL